MSEVLGFMGGFAAGAIVGVLCGLIYTAVVLKRRLATLQANAMRWALEQVKGKVLDASVEVVKGQLRRANAQETLG